MHRRVQAIAAGAALAALLGLAACDDRQASAPTAPDNPALAPTASPCSFSAIKQAASKYLSNKTKDTFYSTVTDQQAAYNLAGLMSQASDPARTNYGFDLLALIARVANTGRQIGSAAQGSALAYATLQCTKYAGELTSSGQFADALGTVTGADQASKAKGVFGVRGGDATQGSPDPATAAVVAKRSAASVPLTWGVETATDLDGTTPLAWSATLAAASLSPSRALIYGVQTNATFPDHVVDGTEPIDVKVIPAAATFSPYAVIGYCDVTPGAAHALIEHLNTGPNPLIPTEIPPFLAPRFCANPPPANVGFLPPGERSPMMLARALAGWGLDLLRPAPLEAMYFATGAGGGKGSVSPFAVVDAGTLQFGFWDLATSRFAHTLGDATTTTKLPELAVAVLSALPNSTPLAAVNVRITVTGNSGSFDLIHGAADTLAGATYVVATGADGIAHFSTPTDPLRLDKAGGYTLKAELDANQAQLSGIVSTDFSNLFHITQ